MNSLFLPELLRVNLSGSVYDPHAEDYVHGHTLPIMLMQIKNNARSVVKGPFGCEVKQGAFRATVSMSLACTGIVLF